MKGPVIFIPFTNVNMGSEDIKSSNKGTSAEGTFASYHPGPKEVLQRFIKPWKLSALGLPLRQYVPQNYSGKVHRFKALAFIYPHASRVLKALQQQQLVDPQPAFSWWGLQRPWESLGGWQGLEWSSLSSRLPLRIFKLQGNPVVQTNFPQKLHRRGTVWKVELFGFGEDCLFGKRWFSFETLFYPFVNRLAF